VQPRDIVAGLFALARALATLTATELKANFGSLRLPLALIAAAAGLLLIGLTLLLVAAVLALAEVVGATAAAAIVAAAAVMVGLALGMAGLSRLAQTRLTPRRSIATLEVQIDRLAGFGNNDGNAVKDQVHD
jgi:apolipoprotein N-acyltransferase